MRIKTELIVSFMNKYGITPYRMCRLCGISRRHFNNIVDNNKEATCNALFQIAKLMEVRITDLIESK